MEQRLHAPQRLIQSQMSDVAAHLLIRPASRPVWVGRRTSSQPAAFGPAPGPSWLWPPGPETGRPRGPHTRCRRCWAAERTGNSSLPPLHSSSGGRETSSPGQRQKNGANSGGRGSSSDHRRCLSVSCEMEISQQPDGL